jgi:hypothetical protein
MISALPVQARRRNSCLHSEKRSMRRGTVIRCTSSGVRQASQSLWRKAPSERLTTSPLTTRCHHRLRLQIDDERNTITRTTDTVPPADSINLHRTRHRLRHSTRTDCGHRGQSYLFPHASKDYSQDLSPRCTVGQYIDKPTGRRLTVSRPALAVQSRHGLA